MNKKPSLKQSVLDNQNDKHLIIAICVYLLTKYKFIIFAGNCFRFKRKYNFLVSLIFIFINILFSHNTKTFLTRGSDFMMISLFCLVVFIFLTRDILSQPLEAKCSRYHYEEQTLVKTVKLERMVEDHIKNNNDIETELRSDFEMMGNEIGKLKARLDEYDKENGMTHKIVLRATLLFIIRCFLNWAYFTLVLINNGNFIFWNDHVW